MVIDVFVLADSTLKGEEGVGGKFPRATLTS